MYHVQIYLSHEIVNPDFMYFDIPRVSIGEGNGTPLQCSRLENPRDGGAWWAAIYGVAQSRTRLKWLSSSSSRASITVSKSHQETGWHLIQFHSPNVHNAMDTGSLSSPLPSKLVPGRVQNIMFSKYLLNEGTNWREIEFWNLVGGCETKMIWL